MLAFGTKWALLDCPFDYDCEEYPETWSVYLVDDETKRKLNMRNWTEVTERFQKVGDIKLTASMFDTTLRKALRREAIAPILDLVQAKSTPPRERGVVTD